MADLRAVRARLRWSDRHVARVRELVDEYLAVAPISVTQRRDPEAGRVIYRAEQSSEPPAEIALAFSDALHQLRATLDNVVGALRVDGPTPDSAFVIARKLADFESRALKELDGVPDWAMDHFRELQPFAGNKLGWMGAELAVLHDLARRDRHRALLLQAALLDVRPSPEDVRYLRHGASIVEADYPDAVTATPDFVVKLVIAESEVASGREVVELIESLASQVRGLIATLDQIAPADDGRSAGEALDAT